MRLETEVLGNLGPEVFHSQVRWQEEPHTGAPVSQFICGLLRHSQGYSKMRGRSGWSRMWNERVLWWFPERSMATGCVWMVMVLRLYPSCAQAGTGTEKGTLPRFSFEATYWLMRLASL